MEISGQQTAGAGREYLSASPEETYELGARLGEALRGGEMILLSGGLGAGKTLLAKGLLEGLGYDPDEVTSPSFTLVNLYRTEKFDVYHLDLWRVGETADAAAAVGLNEILEDESAVTIIEWSERLKDFSYPDQVIRVRIDGDGDDPRKISISGNK